MEVVLVRRRRITPGDWLRGVKYSMRNRTLMNPFQTQRFINAAHDERVANERENFGTGEEGGDKHWTPPVHGATRDGRPVTISFGKGKREGETLVCDGHVPMGTFYTRAVPGKGHDHYLVDGKPAKDRGRFT